MRNAYPRPRPDNLPDGHQCACPNCTPSLKLEGGPIDDHHYSVRFGHENGKPLTNPTIYFPIFNREYQPHAIEDYCHPTDGWILRFTTDPPHVCQVCEWETAGACTELVHGDFMMLILQQDDPKIRVDGGQRESQPVIGDTEVKIE